MEIRDAANDVGLFSNLSRSISMLGEWVELGFVSAIGTRQCRSGYLSWNPHSTAHADFQVAPAALKESQVEPLVACHTGSVRGASILNVETFETPLMLTGMVSLFEFTLHMLNPDVPHFGRYDFACLRSLTVDDILSSMDEVLYGVSRTLTCSPAAIA